MLKTPARSPNWSDGDTLFRELVANYGEDRVAAIADGLSERIRRGEFSLRGRQ
jgi:hypothetical protein